MRPIRTLSLLLCCFLLHGLSLNAQYIVKRVVFFGAAPYEDADLQAIAAVTPGKPMSQEEMQAVSQRLVDTGYFDDVQATLDGPFKAVELRFKIKPVNQARLMRAGFENLVWFQPEELDAALKAKFPLYSHGIPDVGARTTDIEAALTALLATKGVTATISHAVVPPFTGHPATVVEYRVEAPEVMVKAARISGVTPDMAPAVRTGFGRVNGSHFNEGLAGFTTAERVLAPYLDAGYINARLDGVQRSIAPDTGSRRVMVELTGTVVAGEPYRVSTLSFAGTPLVSPDAFAKTAKIHPQDLASRKDLMATLAPVTSAYHDQGYMDAIVDAVPSADPATHLVAYTVKVEPGTQYRLRNLTLKDLPDDLKSEFLKTFKLHAGDVYNEGYVTAFFKQNTAVRAFNGYSGAFSASADPDTHLLDLTITFFHNNGITVH